VTFLVGKPASGTIAVFWMSEERGHGLWPWHDRFGKWEFDEHWRPAANSGPALAYQRPEGFSVVPLQPPFLTYAEPFALEVAWLEGNLEFKVAAEERRNGADTWRIDVHSPIGRRRQIWIDKATPVILAATETVFIGQGEQHDLRWELISRRVLDEDPFTRSVAAFDEFLRLRTRLEIEPRTRDVRWTADRLTLLKGDLPPVVAKAQGTLLEKLAQAVEQDAKNEKDRANALGALHVRLVGRPASQPALETVQNEKFGWSDVKGKVVVLHFWEYRDAPLEEPYGQVAYLDFLARQHKAQDVRVYGIVSDERVTQPDTRQAGIQSAKKLHSFMNLSYPLLVDRGAAIKEFGDPRLTGAKLPLFVVIDRQGKIAHYHAGHYEVNRDRGLEELSTVVRQSLDKRE
jgi:peroxiredoxin